MWPRSKALIRTSRIEERTMFQSIGCAAIMGGAAGTLCAETSPISAVITTASAAHCTGITAARMVPAKMAR